MLKAIFIDHMGTLVYEQSEWLTKLMDVCVENSKEKDAQKIGELWYQKHDELIAQYNGENYKKEYDIALEAFEKDYALKQDGIYSQNDRLILLSALTYHLYQEKEDVYIQKIAQLIQ